jgi:hypothetical protein
VSTTLDHQEACQSGQLVPGLSPARINALIRDAIASIGLDLTDMTILTEAATGAYGVTSVISAAANARHVYAFVRPSEHGSTTDVTAWTNELASSAGVVNRISILERIPPEILRDVDIVTNSGHLRPIAGDIIDKLPQSAVIALMFEAWEFRAEDIDFAACKRRGIPIVGVNEQHRSVDVFSYLGPLSIKLLHDSGIAVYRNRIALLCDNDFAEPILRGLTGLGATVCHFSAVEELQADAWDAILVALRPGSDPRIGASDAAYISKAAIPGTVIAQLWGDIDRDAAQAHDLKVWPPSPPKEGHMAILLSAIGPDALVRLQTGGLRAAELVYRGDMAAPGGVAQLVHCFI